MKKLLLFAFAVFAFAACTQNDVEELSANRADVPETLTVGFEGGDDTRIQLNEAQKTVWTKDDIVSVFYRSNANQKWQYQGETGERVGNLKRVDNILGTLQTTKTIVVYPYSENYWLNTDSYYIDATLPAVQHYAEGSYGVGENLMVSQSEFTQFSLKSVCGWLKIQLTGNGERVTRLTLRGNNEEQLAGIIYVDTATAESTLASEMGSADDNNAGGNLVFDDAIVTELTLDCGEGVVLGAEATSFYFALPPQTFEGGFTVDVECEDSEPMTISTENSITIQRNTIQPMATIELDADAINDTIYYTATAKINKNWDFNTFGANILSHEWNSETGEGVITFDANVATIGNSAFASCDSLTSVTIPDSVTTIGEAAFAFCTSLTSVTIPDSVTTIGAGAFEYCTSLTSVTIPDSVTTIGVGAFGYCDSLTSVTIPDSVTTIGGGAFFYCDSLTSVTIGDSVTTIGDYAFENCSSLTSITIGDSVTTIGNRAFFHCYRLTSITIPDSVVTIGDSAFYWCSRLTSITIPDSITTIGDGAFCGCGSLTEFNGKFASEDSRCLIVDGTLNSFAPAGLTSYTIPDSVTAIGNSAFYNCDSLTSVTIGDSITTIGKSAFAYCTNLISITIPDSVTTIGNSAFYNCDSLTSVTIGDSVTTIGDSAFNICTSLTSVTIPDSVTTIGYYAFYYCTSLTSVYCEATTPPSLDGYVFDDNASGRKIYVPAASVEAYKTADYWSEYADALVDYNFE